MAQPEVYGATKPVRTPQTVSAVRNKLERTPIAAPKTEWVENAPSYLDGIQATLATLTDEEKEALHLSLQG